MVFPQALRGMGATRLCISVAIQCSGLAHAGGLDGYISYSTGPAPAGFGLGSGFYSPIWPLKTQSLAGFQIGLPGTWVLPDNRDNTTIPLCPMGTPARGWTERGPTFESVFQTLEGGSGYWDGNRFHYGLPKFSMNGTPDCYATQIASPGWSFFNGQVLPQDKMGIAQLSNRLLVPPDGITFQGEPSGELLGNAWMALPLSPPKAGPPPTGEHSWTLFLNAHNFKGPVAYYLPETWSRISKTYAFDEGRGLDARQGVVGAGGMEFGLVPLLEDSGTGTKFAKIPRLDWPVDYTGKSLIATDFRFFSRKALYDAVKAWRDGGPAASGTFDSAGDSLASLFANPISFRQGGDSVNLEAVVKATQIGKYGVGLQWSGTITTRYMNFPEYYRRQGTVRSPVAASAAPAALAAKAFTPARTGSAYAAPAVGAWGSPGPARGPFKVRLADRSIVIYSWYRFIDQPCFFQFGWDKATRDALQAMVIKIHANWPIDRNYMPPPSGLFASLASLDQALIVTPPAGLEAGYVPIVTRQESDSVTVLTQDVSVPRREPGFSAEGKSITFNGAGLGMAIVEVHDLRGTLVYRLSGPVPLRFDPDLPKGLYVFRGMRENGPRVQRRMAIGF